MATASAPPARFVYEFPATWGGCQSGPQECAALNTSNLENLIALAQEPSSDKRRALLEGVTDLFLDKGANFGAREQELATDILISVAPRVEVDARAAMSQRLADLDSAPARLVSQLARDMIEVARPILQRSGVLSDEELVEIVNSASAGRARPSCPDRFPAAPFAAGRRPWG